MTGTIARKEFIERWRDGQFRWAAILVFTLLAVALGVGWKSNRVVMAERQTAAQQSRSQWVNQGNRNPHSAAHFGVYAFKPRLPVAFLDPGMDAFTGAALWVEAHYQNPLSYRPAEDGTALQRFGELTAAGVLQVFLPLITILLAFSSFSGEKEQGTLRHLLSLGVPRSSILIGKSLGVAGALACLLLPGAVAGSIALALISEHDFLRQSIWRVIPLALAYAIYLLTYLFLALGVSARVSSSRLALSGLLAFWAAATFLVPRAASDIAERLHPIPVATDFWRVVLSDMKGSDGHSGSDRLFLDLKKKVLAEYGVTRVEDLPVNFEGLRLQAGEEHGNEIFDQRFGDLWNLYAAQERVHHLAGLISPLVAVRSVSMALAGTNLAHLRDFTDSAEQYRRTLNRSMNLNLAQNSRFGQTTYAAGREFWKQTPAFDYRTPSAAWALSREMLPGALLFLWLIGCVAFAWLAAFRMRVV